MINKIPQEMVKRTVAGYMVVDFEMSGEFEVPAQIAKQGSEAVETWFLKNVRAAAFMKLADKSLGFYQVRPSESEIAIESKEEK